MLGQADSWLVRVVFAIGMMDQLGELEGICT